MKDLLIRRTVWGIVVMLWFVCPWGRLEAESSPVWRFTFVAPLHSGNADEYWPTVSRGVQAASRDFSVNTNETGPVYEENSDLMVQAIEMAIAAKVDGIVTMALDPPRFRTVINKAASAGIPVVLVDSDAPDSRRVAYIGTDNFAAGQRAAAIMIQVTGGRGKIGVISGPREVENLKLRIQGFESGLAKCPGLKIVDLRSRKSDLLMQSELVQSMLKDHPEITALFGVDGFGSLAAALVIRQSQLAGKITVVGFDKTDQVVENIRTGLVKAVVLQDCYQMGYEAIKTLVALKNGHPPAQALFYTGTSTLTRENLTEHEK